MYMTEQIYSKTHRKECRIISIGYFLININADIIVINNVLSMSISLTLNTYLSFINRIKISIGNDFPHLWQQAD